MLTGYWSIDAFITANILLCLIVAVIFGYNQITKGGMLCDQSSEQDQRSKS